MPDIEGVQVKVRSAVMLYPLRKKTDVAIQGSDGEGGSEPIEGTEEE